MATRVIATAGGCCWDQRDKSILGVQRGSYVEFQRFPDLGKELRRPFEIHECCYDCAAFYDGCSAWPASKPCKCRYYQRLPDVMPGTYGQRLPDKVIVPENPTGDQQPMQRTRTGGAEPGPKKPCSSRRCRCGAVLPKGKRLCDQCRIENRRQTKRQYMRGYMGQRRSDAVRSASDMFSVAPTTPSMQAIAGERAPTRPALGGSRSRQTSVLTDTL